MFVERELVPFFPTEGAEEETTPQTSPKSVTKRTRRLRKADAPNGDSRSSSPRDGAAKDASAAPKAKKGAKKDKGSEAPVTAPQQAKGKKAASSPPHARGGSPSARTPPKAPAAANTSAFAGAAFEQSPHPSSLPTPRFVGRSASPPAVPASPVAADAQAATLHLRSLLGVAPTTQAAVPDHMTTGHDPMATQQLCSILGVKAC